MNQEQYSDQWTSLIMIATPDPIGTIRFPPLLQLSTTAASATLEPYFGHPLSMPQGKAKYDSAITKQIVNRYLEKVFFQDMQHMWLFDETFEESILIDSFPRSASSIFPYISVDKKINLLLLRITMPLAHRDWPSFPQILRSLPKTKIRIPYLKMFQILMGQQDEKTEAVGLDDLKKMIGPDKQN